MFRRFVKKIGWKINESVSNNTNSISAKFEHLFLGKGIGQDRQIRFQGRAFERLLGSAGREF